MGDEDYWRKIINDLDIPFPASGEASPNVEKLVQRARVFKLYQVTYLIMPEDMEHNTIYMQSVGQKVEDYGTLPIPEIVDMIKRKR